MVELQHFEENLREFEAMVKNFRTNLRDEEEQLKKDITRAEDKWHKYAQRNGTH